MQCECSFSGASHVAQLSCVSVNAEMEAENCGHVTHLLHVCLAANAQVVVHAEVADALGLLLRQLVLARLREIDLHREPLPIR